MRHGQAHQTGTVFVLTTMVFSLVSFTPAGADITDCLVPLVDDRCETWVAGPADPDGEDPVGSQQLRDVALSPSGARLYVTGTHPSWGFATVAFSTGTGRAAWAARYRSPDPDLLDRPRAIAVSPHGDLVFVTGSRMADHYDYNNSEFLVVAYDAATGGQEWSAWLGDRALGSNRGADLAVGPDGEVLFVTGHVTATHVVPCFEDDPELCEEQEPLSYTDADILTVAYEAATGKELWRSQYDAGANAWGQGFEEYASRITVSPDGTRAFVSGTNHNGSLVIAYDAETGAQIWKDDRGSYERWTADLVVSPDGRTLYATGDSTLAFNAATGAHRWFYQHNSDNGIYEGQSLALGDDGVLFLGGAIWNLGLGGTNWPTNDTVVQALDANTGELVWSARDGAAKQGGASLAVSPDGSRLVAVGYRCATMGLDPASGTRLWGAQYLRRGYLPECTHLLMHPDGKRVFTAGTLGGPVDDGLFDSSADPDYMVLAYDV